jgi:ectoine hydroxylase-related dioxygenase (phytanoyl-CoA dioxygenase family)
VVAKGPPARTALVQRVLIVLPFPDSTHLLDDHAALRARFAEDGFVYLRDVIDHDMLLELRAQITRICATHGWFDPSRSPMDAVTCVEPCVEGDDRYFEVYDDVQRLEAFHAVPHHPSVRACMTALLGDSAFPHPLGIARLIFPGNEEWATPPHQDYPNNQGTPDLYACWMPLGDCPTRLGALSVLRGSHRFGVAPLEFSLGPGNRQARLDARFQGLEWVGGDFDLGDAVIFHSHTVHRSLPNVAECLRLSVDYRFQREREPLVEGCLRPHFARLTWEEIYRDWDREDLKYYWRDKRYTVVPWDPTFHKLSEEEQAESMRIARNWRPEARIQLAKELIELRRSQARDAP